MKICKITDILNKSEIHVQYLHNVACPLHLHYNMEIVYSTFGTLQMEVSGEKRTIRAGEITFIMPFESHSFQHLGENDCVVLVFDPRIADSFFQRMRGRTYAPKVFSPDADVMAYADRFLRMKETDEIILKSILYPLCAQLIRNCQIDAEESRGNEILFEALTYMAEHFKGELTLVKTAKHIGVHPVYLSRYFSMYAGLPFSVYLNMMKFSHAERMLREGTYDMSEIAFESGFGSLRNFNRVFHKLSGKTPTQYACEGCFITNGVSRTD